ncbi:hypothetical protein Cni_G15043 [Canna indica]|uniref:TmcB/TmcC TPR repeats domain-containing protein n=1 Tax=Canna indica TaxID=4628 RepID=A0AAQ3KIV4_9LILI|nr:hypothetical protein Cni_G15043 [Canna indica]
MRTATPIRTGSFLGSPRRGASPARPRDSVTGRFFPRRSSSFAAFSPRSGRAAALHLEAEGGRGARFLRRAKSEADLFGPNRLNRERAEQEGEAADLAVNRSDLVVASPGGLPTESAAEYCGGGTGKKGRKGGGDGGGGGQNNRRRISDYYQQMLRSDPSNPLLLRNYGRFLHEVEGDAEGAAEYYGRAILENPEDGEVMSLYGKLLWEVHGNGERAEAYFERAVEASPDDCYVLGSYAQFLWDAEDEEEDRRTEERLPLVEAF